jgi:toxin ParE1/3/4
MQRKRSQNLERIIDMKHYTVEITNEALADMDQYNRIADAILTLDTMAERICIMESEPERSKEMRRLLVDNYSVFFVIQGDNVIVTDVLYSASDIESRLKG